MNFFCLVTVFILEPLVGRNVKQRGQYATNSYFNFLIAKIGPFEVDRNVSKLILVCILPALLAWAIFSILSLIHPLLALVFNITILLSLISFKPCIDILKVIEKCMREGHLEQARELALELYDSQDTDLKKEDIVSLAICGGLLKLFHCTFGIVFWFIVLPGPSGAVAYFILYQYLAKFSKKRETLKKRESKSYTDLIVDIVEWLPARLFASSIAIVGNFDDAITCWRNQMNAEKYNSKASFVIAAFGAMSVRSQFPAHNQDKAESISEIGIGSNISPENLLDLVRLVSRTIFIWVGFLGLLLVLALLS